MVHGLRRSSCEIVGVDELNDFDDLPHPDTLFSQLWQDDTPWESCETSGENLSSDAMKPFMPDLAMQDGLREFPQKYALEAEVYARDSCQTDGIDETSSSLDTLEGVFSARWPFSLCSYLSFFFPMLVEWLFLGCRIG